MTSASNHPATVPVAAARIDAVAERIATDWGHHGHTTLTTMIVELYTDLAALPPHWTPQQNAAVIDDAADIITTELTTLLDDYLDHDAISPHITEYGWAEHSEDRHHVTTTVLATLTADHLTWWVTDGIHTFITDPP